VQHESQTSENQAMTVRGGAKVMEEEEESGYSSTSQRADGKRHNIERCRTLGGGRMAEKALDNRARSLYDSGGATSKGGKPPQRTGLSRPACTVQGGTSLGEKDGKLYRNKEDRKISPG